MPDFTCPTLLWILPASDRFAYRAFTLFGCASHHILLAVFMPYAVRNPINISTNGLASFLFAHHYSENRFFFLFLRLLRCFSSAGSLPYTILFMQGYYDMAHSGFPHSDICGSPDICSSPQLFAAYHVLHRLLMPRHPPCALSSLTFLLLALSSSSSSCESLPLKRKNSFDSSLLYCSVFKILLSFRNFLS